MNAKTIESPSIAMMLVLNEPPKANTLKKFLGPSISKV
jgi:hypothetical protein